MEFDGTTFVLEIINFMVLVWILQRFLYRPVSTAIAERKLMVEKALADARDARAAAESLEQKYAGRMAEWEAERQEARMRLTQEMSEERSRTLRALQIAAEKEGEKLQAIERQRAVERSRALEEEAVIIGAKFVARLLTRIADADLEGRILEMVVEDLSQLSRHDVGSLRSAYGEGGAVATVTSSFPLLEEQGRKLAHALSRVVGRPVEIALERDPLLVAGLRIDMGPWTLRASLRDELEFFSRAQHRPAP